MNFYNPMYEANLKNIIEQAQNQLAQMHNQPQPTNLTQNFQLAPQNNQNVFKMVNTRDEVDREIVTIETYFLSRNFLNLWIKNPRGDIRVFDLKEIKPKDERDILIENLQKEINELKGSMNYGYKPNGIPNAEPKITEPTATEKSANVSGVSAS